MANYVLTMPGIMSVIADHMKRQNDDRGLKSMYVLFNDPRYREEMDPFVAHIIENRERMLAFVVQQMKYFDHHECNEEYRGMNANWMVMCKLYSIVFKYPDFFECDEAIRYMYDVYPNGFVFAIRKYRDHNALVCDTIKQNHYNRARSLTVVHSADDVMSYPLITDTESKCILYKPCACVC